MRARFDSSYIRSELERIGQQLDDPLTVFLIGGGAMAFRDLKTTTKDIDLIVASGADLGQLQAVLLELGERSVVRENRRLTVTVLKRQHEDCDVFGLDSTDAGERLYRRR
jgi:DNA polymerase/3'-5' exonuclease PolX